MAGPKVRVGSDAACALGLAKINEVVAGISPPAVSRLRGVAYASDLIEVAPGRYELEPRVLAKMISELAPRPDELALVIGSGGGYASAVLSRLCAAVIALEQDEALHTSAKEALSEVGVDTVVPETGNHREGRMQHAPYNLILVNGPFLL